MTQLLPRRDNAPAASARARHLWGGTLVGPVCVAALAGGVLAALQVLDPTEPGHYPTCPFLALTGWFCPGCGSLRMLHELGDGDLSGAAAMNPLGLLMIVALVAYWLGWVVRGVTGRPRGAPMPGWVVWVFLVVTLAYAVLRNLPGMGVLAPG